MLWVQLPLCRHPLAGSSRSSGAELPAGVAVCDRCHLVFRPRRTSAARRCEGCHDRRAGAAPAALRRVRLQLHGDAQRYPLLLDAVPRARPSAAAMTYERRRSRHCWIADFLGSNL